MYMDELHCSLITNIHTYISICTYQFHHEESQSQIKRLMTSCSPWKQHHWPHPQGELSTGWGRYDAYHDLSMKPSLDLYMVKILNHMISSTVPKYEQCV